MRNRLKLIRTTRDVGRGEATIDIMDKGPGIHDSERERVFERFYRMNGVHSRAEGGAGLGLSIARWAVEANGGGIIFLDRVERGTACRIMLTSSPPESY